jgi:hypothetical protein
MPLGEEALMTALASPYRCDDSDDLELLRRRDEYARQRAAVGPLVAIGSRNRALTAAGWVAIATFVLLCSLFVVRWIASSAHIVSSSTETGATPILLGGVVASAATYFVARAAFHVYGSLLLAEPREADRSHLLEWFRWTDPRAIAFEWASGFRRGGRGSALAGFCLLAPLTIHWGIAGTEASFDRWIELSLICAGHSHIVLAIVADGFAARLATHRADSTSRPSAVRWSFIGLVSAAVVAVIPSVIFAPVIIIATGIIPVPIAFAFAGYLADDDDEILAKWGA